MSGKTVWNALLSFFFPTYCVGCGVRLGQEHAHICPTCFEGLPQTDGVESYYHPESRVEGFVPVGEVHSDLIYDEHSLARLLIHRIKYNDYPSLATRLARHYAPHHLAQGHYADVTCIVPMPIAPNRLRRRGYNQTEFLARGWAYTYQLPLITHALQRPKSGTQTQRGKDDRFAAMQGAFYGKPGCLQGRRVLLIDDVLTSGATAIHAARALYDDCGAESVSIYTLALDVKE